ncbi:MAG: hypothetical protein ACTHMZ_16190 [Actinomycetes bacterium]
MVEFLALGLVLLVPVAYLVLVVFRVQAASYGLAAATREAGRAYLTAPATDVALDRAEEAARVALADQSLSLAPGSLRVECVPDCRLAPDHAITVRMSTAVTLPLVPAALGGGSLAVTVSGEHTETTDRFRMSR